MKLVGWEVYVAKGREFMTPKRALMEAFASTGTA
jgi:hypothetical protein